VNVHNMTIVPTSDVADPVVNAVDAVGGHREHASPAERLDRPAIMAAHPGAALVGLSRRNGRRASLRVVVACATPLTLAELRAHLNALDMPEW
jgi:hypothetical protein